MNPGKKILFIFFSSIDWTPVGTRCSSGYHKRGLRHWNSQHKCFQNRWRITVCKQIENSVHLLTSSLRVDTQTDTSCWQEKETVTCYCKATSNYTETGNSPPKVFDRCVWRLSHKHFISRPGCYGSHFETAVLLILVVSLILETLNFSNVANFGNVTTFSKVFVRSFRY